MKWLTNILLFLKRTCEGINPLFGVSSNSSTAWTFKGGTETSAHLATRIELEGLLRATETFDGPEKSGLALPGGGGEGGRAS